MLENSRPGTDAQLLPLIDAASTCDRLAAEPGRNGHRRFNERQFAHMRYDIAIIGGGVIGCAIARALSRFHLKIILLEKECEVGFGTSKSNSGIIHAGHNGATGTLKGELEWAGNRMWDTLHEELDFGFFRNGELMVAMSDDQMPTLEHFRRQGVERGVTGLEIWDGDRVRREEPALSPDIVAALHAPTAGVVNPYEVCFSLIENACRNGVELLTDCRVEAITRNGDGGFRLATSQRAIDARFIVNAAGLFSDEIARMAGAGDFRIRPRKGEEYLLDKRLKGMVKRTIFPCPTPQSKGILVIPTYDGTLMIGPTAGFIDDKNDRSTSAAGSDEIFSAVRRFAPGISERDCIAEFAGLRAVVDGDDFIIAPSSQKGFINCAGIQSPGLTAAPAIAERIIDILRDEGLSMSPNAEYNPHVVKRVRMATLPLEEQMRLAAEDPRLGRIGCRCEQISEREIIDAIHAGAKTLDGIKFRTRAGMGRCQGGFCSWRSMQLLSAELKVPMTAITKRGGNTWIVCDRNSDSVKEGGDA
jgi:glycerol-3-phosphate dehydrogenase